VGRERGGENGGKLEQRAKFQLGKKGKKTGVGKKGQGWRYGEGFVNPIFYSWPGAG